MAQCVNGNWTTKNGCDKLNDEMVVRTYDSLHDCRTVGRHSGHNIAASTEATAVPVQMERSAKRSDQDTKQCMEGYKKL